LEDSVKDMLEEYRVYSRNRIKYRFIDPKEDKEEEEVCPVCTNAIGGYMIHPDFEPEQYRPKKIIIKSQS